MQPWIVACVMGGFAVLAALSLIRALREGVASSFVQTYYMDEQPVGYALCIVSEIGVVALGAAVVLHALGLIGDPFAAINAVLPPFLSCSHGDCPP